MIDHNLKQLEAIKDYLSHNKIIFNWTINGSNRYEEMWSMTVEVLLGNLQIYLTDKNIILKTFSINKTIDCDDRYAYALIINNKKS